VKLLSRSSIALSFVLGTALFPATRCAGGPALAAVGGVMVNVLPLPSPLGGGSHDSLQHGRLEYRVHIKNTAKEDRVVHLQIPAPSPYRPDAGTIVSRTVPIAAGQEAMVSLFQFPDGNEGTMEVRVEGVSEKETVQIGAISSAYYSYGGTSSADWARPAVLLSRSISLDSYKSPAAGSTVGPPELVGLVALETNFKFFHSELPVTQWSANWLGYSCFDAVWLTEKDVEQMPPEVQLALRRYLECGGTLLVHGQKVPAVFSENAMEDSGGGYFVGRGHAVAGGAKDEANLYMAAQTLRRLSLLPNHEYGNPKAGDPHHLLVAESRVPVRGMFALVLLFAVAIGPANLWLLSRYKRRIWLWWDVPAISLLTCLAVFGYSVFSEGWRGHGKTASMTLLDQRTHRATTFGYVSYYCPLTPFSGPHFGADTDVTMIDEESSRYPSPEPYRRRANLDARYVDFSSDQDFAGGWVRARVPAYFPFCKNEDRRERLNFSMKGDVPTVVNALGADIDRLYWADASGKVFAGRDIAAGAEKALAASTETPANPRPASGYPGYPAAARGRVVLHDAMGVNFAGGLLSALDRYRSDDSPAQQLVPGAYIAYLKKSPFVEASLAGTPSEDTVAIVYGICEGQANGR